MTRSMDDNLEAEFSEAFLHCLRYMKKNEMTTSLYFSCFSKNLKISLDYLRDFVTILWLLNIDITPSPNVEFMLN